MSKLIVLILIFLLSVFLCQVKCNVFKKLLGSSRKNKLKREILDLSKKLQRGLCDDTENEKQMQKLFRQLEELNINGNTLSNPNLNGEWNLEYTSSKTLIGKDKIGRKTGAISQKINVRNLKAENSEVISFFGLPPFKSSVTANLRPESKSKAGVIFDRFSVGGIKFPAPKGYYGFIDVTYIDDDLRLTRGDKGNIFVLTKKKGTNVDNTLIG